jgi:hypothetical protein
VIIDTTKDREKEDKRRQIRKQRRIETMEAPFAKFIAEVARPALEVIHKKLAKHNREVELSASASNFVQITVKKKNQSGILEDEFIYAIEVQHDVPGVFPRAMVHFMDKKNGTWQYRPMHIKDTAKELENTTKNDIVNHFIKIYKEHTDIDLKKK